MFKIISLQRCGIFAASRFLRDQYTGPFDRHQFQPCYLPDHCISNSVLKIMEEREPGVPGGEQYAFPRPGFQELRRSGPLPAAAREWIPGSKSRLISGSATP